MAKKKTKSVSNVIPLQTITNAILFIRGHKIILDEDLAKLYEVETRILTRAVKRNLERFPEDFMFQLNEEEYENLRSHLGISNQRGGRRYLPYAFTEQGVAMLSSVLRSERAVLVNIEIMRTFVKIREMLPNHKDLTKKLDNLEKKYDKQFRIVFDAIRQLMNAGDDKKKRPIGFAPWSD